MKKIFYISLLFLLLTQPVFGAPPTRVSTYTTGEVISSSAVTANEDAIFNYLTAGVDTYADLTIINADVKAAANIQSDKLNLTSIAQGVKITSGGSFENDGTSDFDGNVTFAGSTIADLGTVTTAIITTADINGGTLDGVTIGGTAAPTVTDLGTVTTADINGGTMDGVQVDGSTTDGMLFVTEATTNDLVELGAQGTAGQYLQSAGTGSNPTWASMQHGVLFGFFGTSIVATQDGICTNSSLTPNNCDTTGLFLYTDETSASDIYETKFQKTAHDTIEVHAEIWNQSGSITTLDIEINGTLQCGSAMTHNTTTPTWKTCDIDVSSLTDGTVYVVQFELQTDNEGNEAMASQVVAFGK